MPIVTVLIAARNAERTFAETLDSLAAQTFKDFEVLLVNDASTDRTLEIALGFQDRLTVKALSLEQNAGVAGALNYGLAQIDTPYIARIDADDIALPTRIEKQVAFLESEPDIDVCGTWMELFYDNPESEARILVKPSQDAAIKTALIQYCALSHGSAMFRKSFFDDVGKFDLRFDFAEDYDLWCRGALLGKRYANLPEALTRYRQHGNQVGQQKRQLQHERDIAIRRKYLTALLNDGSSGILAEFFSKRVAFINRDVALSVIVQSLPLLFKLSERVTDQATYNQIVAECFTRHLTVSE